MTAAWAAWAAMAFAAAEGFFLLADVFLMGMVVLIERV
jgi:hypothetical protein